MIDSLKMRDYFDIRSSLLALNEMKPWFADGEALSAETIIPRITAPCNRGMINIEKRKDAHELLRNL